MKTRLLLIAITVTGLSGQIAKAVTPAVAEIAEAKQWMASHFEAAPEGKAAEPFFSFSYDGKPSGDLLKTWKVERSTRKIDDKRTEHTLAYTDPKTGLVVRCVGVEYSDFPTVEWTLYFKNSGTGDTPIIADIQAIDLNVVRSGDAEFTLHRTKGDTCAIDAFQPLVQPLGPKASVHLAPGGGRPTNGENPYWNFKTGDKGLIVVLGWPGQWLSKFDRDDAKTLRIRAGQELTHFKLLPGEEVRSPLIVLQFYEGDWIRGQNIWRRWMVVHNIPRPGGKLVPTHYGACWSDPLHPVGKIEMDILGGYIREKIPLDFYFIDAGWYPSKRDWWTDAGTWEVDKERFPKGIREVSDLAHANGMKFVLWFEPERAGPNTWLSDNHPEWIIGGKNGGLVNLGNADARKWITDRIDSLIKSEGIDVYRQDFNFDPLGSWRSIDAKDRQGITEIGHCTGYLAYWDELVRRNPGLWVDSCASGGRRNDLETMRRAVPLLRSDCFGDPTIQQCLTYGLSFWIPYHGSGTIQPTKYWFRSTIFPASRVGWDTRKKELDYKLLKDMIAEFRKVQPYLLGDYYPLTPYSMEKTALMAWQFDEPELGGGFVQAFRREEAKEDTLVLKLQGLDPNATYAVENLDGNKVEKRTGKDLMETGLQVKITEKPGAALFVYKKVLKGT
jgi:alpha-galactosidase